MYTKHLLYSLITATCFTSVSFAQMGGNYKWNNPSSSLPSGCTHGTYHSDLMNVDVGYNVYLPPDYDNDDDRYPVIYSLHGMSGNEGSNCATFAPVLKDGITSNSFPPVIMVFVSGRGNTFYSDSKDGTIKGESTIIDELVPYIDKTYRTKADRTRRGVEGVSMGGFGALMLGFKHPDIFGSIASYDAALVNWDTLSQQQFDQSIPKSIFGSDRDYFNSQSYPFTFAKRNADTIKALGIKVRMITGDNDMQMGPLYYYNLAMRDTLKALGIPLDMKIIPGGTHGKGMNATTAKENMIFHTDNFSNAPTGTISRQHASAATLSDPSWCTAFQLTPSTVDGYDAGIIYNLLGRSVGRRAGMSNGSVRTIGSGLYLIKTANRGSANIIH